MQRVPLGMRSAAQSLPHGHPQRSSLVSQHPPWLSTAGYPAGCTGFDQQQAHVGSVGARHVKRRRVDNGQYPSRLSVQQQHMVGILPQHQHQDQAQAQAHWHAQQIYLATTPLWHVHGHSPTHTAPSTFHHSHANVPMQNPLDAIPIAAVHSGRTSGGSHESQGQDKYNSGPAIFPQPTQMQAYQPYTSPPLAVLSPPILPRINEPSHVPRYLALAPNETHNSGVGQSGFDINTSGASTSGEPTLPNLGNQTPRIQDPKPYKRPAHHAARKSRPAGYEGDVMLLQQRCRRQGAGEDVIGFIAKIFPRGVNLEALTRQLTDSEVEALEIGVGAGKAYTAFLAPTSEGEGEAPGYVCRLCHRGQAWKHSKDVLRHLRRDHFGLADVCKKCSVKFYTKGEMTRHPCKPIKRSRLTGTA